MNSDEKFKDEINLIKILLRVWSKKFLIAIYVGVSIVLGLIVAFTTPKMYTSNSILIPERVSTSPIANSSLKSLASLAGVDLSNTSQSSISVALYSSIIESTPFMLTLLDKEFFFKKEGKSMTLYDFMRFERERSLISIVLDVPSNLLALLKSKEEPGDLSPDGGIVEITIEQKAVFEILRGQIQVSHDIELNVVNIKVEMQDAKVAAQVTQFITDYITAYVIEYSEEKNKEQLAFVENLYAEKQKEFERAQHALAAFRDENQFVQSSVLKTEEQNLLNKYNLEYGLFNQLALELQSLRIRIKERKPIFKIMEPSKVSPKHSSPNRPVILVVFVFLGFFFAVASIFIGAEFSKYKAN